MTLGLEELQSFVIGNDMDSLSNQFVFPLEEGLKYGNHLMLKGAVVPLSIGKLLGQESSWAACLPIRPLSIHCSYPKDIGITYDPYQLARGWVDCFQYGHPAADVLDHLETVIVQWAPLERLTIPSHC